MSGMRDQAGSVRPWTPADVVNLERRVQRFAGNGHACVQCQGVGTVRIYGRPGYERKPCPGCGGSGLLRPTR
jgi:RecJ-like exonuclease